MPRKKQSRNPNGTGSLIIESGKYKLKISEKVWEKDHYRNKRSTIVICGVSEVVDRNEAWKLAQDEVARLRKIAPPSVQASMKGCIKGTMHFVPFVDEVYLPSVEKNKEASTHAGYRNNFDCYFRNRPELQGVQLRQFRTCTVESMLQTMKDEVTRQSDGLPLSSRTFDHLRSLLSGIFTHAIRMGYLDGENPVHKTSKPKTHEGGTLPFYTLGQTFQMLTVLPPGPIQLAVAIAAFAGLSRSELRGLKWRDYDRANSCIVIQRKVWRGLVGDPKTKNRKAPIPVIGQLRELLDGWHEMIKPNGNDWILIEEGGGQLNLDGWIERSVIEPILKIMGIEWHGWHGFRRGLGTKLKQLKVDSLLISRILRNRKEVAEAHYIQTPTEELVKVMAAFESKVQEQAQGRVPLTLPPRHLMD